MKAVILAAGCSRRLRPILKYNPKCLLEIGSELIIDRQIDSLVQNGIKKITIVVGYKAERIMRHLTKNFSNLHFQFIYNPFYYKTNTIYSLHLAQKEMDEDFLYFNGDVLFDKKIVKELVLSPYKDVLAINKSRVAEEEVKVVLDKDLVLDIGKKLDPAICAGEFIGIAKFSKRFNRFFKKELKKEVEKGNVNDFFEKALQNLVLRKHKLYVKDITKYPVIEIDFPKDLEKAKKEIYKLIKD